MQAPTQPPSSFRRSRSQRKRGGDANRYTGEQVPARMEPRNAGGGMEEDVQPDPKRIAADAMALGRERLGPAAEAFLSQPEVQVLVISRVRNGFDLEDAVLAEVHRACGEHKVLANEFIGYFLSDLLRVGHRVRSNALQRFLDTGDLVQSVLGDFWPDLLSVQFETRGRFLSYLSRRMNWKAADRVRALRSGRRREDRRAEVEPEELEVKADQPSPFTIAADSDDREWLALALLRLPERDQRLLKLHLKGASITEIAEEVGLFVQRIQSHAGRVQIKGNLGGMHFQRKTHATFGKHVQDWIEAIGELLKAGIDHRLGHRWKRIVQVPDT